MFDNLPDNVSHADFNESPVDGHVEYVNDLLPEWLRDFAEDQITDMIRDDFEYQIDPEVTVQTIKEAVPNELVESYMEHFDYLVAKYHADYLPEYYRVKYNKFTDKLELHMKFTPDGDYFVASVSCFKDREGYQDDAHFVQIAGKSGDVRLTESESFETTLTGDLDLDALHFCTRLMKILERA